MILDKYNEFFKELDIPSSAGTTTEGDVIDLTDYRDIGNGQPVYWYVSVTEDGEDGTSVNVQLVTSDNADLSAGTVVAQTGVVALADLTAGAMLAMMALPLAEYKRYVGVQVVVDGSFTGGALSSGLTLDPHGWRPYPANEGTVA